MKIEKSIYGNKKVCLFTPAEIRDLVETSEDAKDFERRIKNLTGTRRFGMLYEYTTVGGERALYRWLDGMPITTGSPPESHTLRVKFPGRGFTATASCHQAIG